VSGVAGEADRAERFYDLPVVGRYPKRFSAEHAPTSVIAVVQRLMPLLLAADHPPLAILREQYRRATIASVELTGSGFYAMFSVPADAPHAEPADFSGGDAVLTLDTAPHGGACVLHVRAGRLESLEGYTFDGAWTEETKVMAVGDVVPIRPR
jgi:hypothetical protein